MHDSPRVLPGPLCKKDPDGSLCWESYGLLAYASHSYVVVLEAETLAVVQTLDEHKGRVTQLAWATERLHNNLDKPFILSLASGDSSGTILVWNVLEASVMMSLSDPKITIPVAQIAWDAHVPTCLLALYAVETDPEKAEKVEVSSATNMGANPLSNPASALSSVTGSSLTSTSTSSSSASTQDFNGDSLLVLWDTLKGTKLWQKDIIASTFTIDPFNPSVLCLATSNGTVSLMYDFNRTTEPETLAPQFHINKKTSGPKWRPTISYEFEEVEDANSFFALQEDSPSPFLKDFKTIFFSPSESGLLLVVLERAVVMYDLCVRKQVGMLQLEDAVLSSFRAFYLHPLATNIGYSLHVNGCIAMWIKVDAEKDLRKKEERAYADGPYSQRTYRLVCSTDNLRTARVRRTQGACCSVSLDPKRPDILAGLYPDGSLFRYSTTKQKGEEGAYALSVVAVQECISLEPSSIAALPHYMWESGVNEEKVPHLLAVGCQSGTLFTVEVTTYTIQRVLSLATTPLKDILWLSPSVLLCYTVKQVDHGSFRGFENKVFKVNLQSGACLCLRNRNNKEEDAEIKSISLSPCMSYVVVLLRDRPVEIWSIATSTLLCTVEIRDANALAWTASSHFPSSNVAKQEAANQDYISLGRILFATATGLLRCYLIRKKVLGGSGQLDSTSEDLRRSSTSAPSLSPAPPSLEEFSFTHNPSTSAAVLPNPGASKQYPGSVSTAFSKNPSDGHRQEHLPEFAGVEANVSISAVPDVKVDLGIGSGGAITCLATKDSVVVCGDSFGLMHCLDFKAKTTKTYKTNRGAVKKIIFCPAAESDEALVMFKNGDFGIWDFRQSVRRSLSTYLRSRDLGAIDVGWFGPAQPVITCSDGAFRLLDKSLSVSNSSAKSLLLKALHCPTENVLFRHSDEDFLCKPPRFPEPIEGQSVPTPPHTLQQYELLQYSAIGLPSPILLPSNLALSLKAHLQHPQLILSDFLQAQRKKSRNVERENSDGPSSSLSASANLLPLSPPPEVDQNSLDAMEHVAVSVMLGLCSAENLYRRENLNEPNLTTTESENAVKMEDYDIASICLLVARYFGDNFEVSGKMSSFLLR